MYWYVTGQAGGLRGPDGATITAGHLGWAPHLLTTEGNGEVAEGEQVGTVLRRVGAEQRRPRPARSCLALALDSQPRPRDRRMDGERRPDAEDPERRHAG